MTGRPETRALLDDLERRAGSRLSHRETMAFLVDSGRTERGRRVLEELAFLGKFVTRARGVLSRGREGGEDTSFLEKEFEEGLRKVAALLGFAFGGGPAEARMFESRYLGLTKEALGALLGLCRELGWYQDMLIDRKRPGEGV